MLNIRKVIEPWQEAGSLNANLNLYGFFADDVFITKTGDLGMTCDAVAWITKVWIRTNSNTPCVIWNRL